jgi:hypothetical protein
MTGVALMTALADVLGGLLDAGGAPPLRVAVLDADGAWLVLRYDPPREPLRILGQSQAEDFEGPVNVMVIDKYGHATVRVLPGS